MKSILNMSNISWFEWITTSLASAWAHQLGRLQRSLDSDSLATLIYVVVNSWIDYCNTVLANAPRTVTDKLQHVLNAAVHVVTGTWKFDRGLGQILHDELHWLDVPDWVYFKLAVTVYQCRNGRALPYLSDYCIPVASADIQYAVWSVQRHTAPHVDTFTPYVLLQVYALCCGSTSGDNEFQNLSQLELSHDGGYEAVHAYSVFMCSPPIS